MFRKQFTSEEIMNGLLSGDPDIYKYLDQSFRKNVIRHVCSNSGSIQDGEELYQDVVFEIYLNMERGRYDVSRSKFSTYFSMIMKNRWKDRLRKKQRLIHTTELTESTNQICQEEEHENYISRVKEMHLCIAKLKQDEQEMIKLFYFAKMSLESVASTMDISYGYAKQKIHRIREKLRMLMDDHTTFSSQFELTSNTPPIIDGINKYPN